MKKTKIIAWYLALLIGSMLFLLTKNCGRHNLIIGFETVLIFIFSLEYYLHYFKLAGKIY